MPSTESVDGITNMKRGRQQAFKFRSETETIRPTRRREKYTRRACETCKTRKVKCSGLAPCSRCVELKVECRYEDSFSGTPKDSLTASGRMAKRRRTSTLSNNPELERLVLNMRKVCDDIESSVSNCDLPSVPVCSLKRSRRHFISGNPVIVRPSPSYVHLLDMAQDVLAGKGFFENSQGPSPADVAASDGATVTTSTPADEILLAAKPIIHLGRDKAFRYFAIFRDHVYSALPCIGLSVVEERMAAVFSARSPPGGVNQFHDLGFDIIDIELMKVTFAIAMILEGDTDNSLCRDLMAHLLWNVDNIINEERTQIEDVIMATLLTIYFTLKSQPLIAWRMIRFAATTSLELGLHRDKPTEQCNHMSTLASRDIFLCVYDLDKRCSFFAGLPWTLHHEDIGANVMALDDRHPYMSAMLRLDRVHTEILRFNAAVPPSGSKETYEKIEIYDYRIQKLMDSVNAQSIFPPGSPSAPPPGIQHVMSNILQLRANQIRMAVYMRYLSKACDGSTFKDQALNVLVSLAKSSVDVFLRIPEASPLWRPLADRLIMGSISYMFLLASQDPNKYGPLCRKAFHTAIKCLKQSSYVFTESESDVWYSLDDLQRLGAKIQMPLFDESPPAEMPSVQRLDSISTLDSDLNVSPEELAQLCRDTSRDSMSNFWDATSLWEKDLGEFEWAGSINGLLDPVSYLASSSRGHIASASERHMQ